MNITFRQLRVFLALVDTGSVSAAARMVHVTQPTASMQLKEITDAVGLPIYEVVARKVHLTQIGQELAITARIMANQWAVFEQQVDGLKGLTRGRLKVAVVSTAKYFIPRILGSFCAFMSNPLLLVAPKDHATAKKRNIDITALMNENFIFREKGSGTRMATDEHFKKLKLKPNVRLELGSNEAIKQAVIGGLGLAVLSKYSLGENTDQEEITILKCKDFPIVSSWHIVSPKGKKLSPIATIFKKHLSDQAKGWR